MLVLAFWDSLQYLQFFRPQADFGVGVGVGHQAVSAVSAAERACLSEFPAELCFEGCWARRLWDGCVGLSKGVVRSV